MAYRRKKYLDLDSTKHYHCITRCVRRSFLCGYDELTKKDYNYRKEIIQNLLKILTKAYSIEVCSYSIMCNHIHLVLYVNESKVQSFSQDDILNSWSIIYPNSASKIKASILNNEEESDIKQKVDRCKSKLYSISSFMEKFCLTLSKQFNKEDNCKGRFWEGKFYLQPIYDLQALINTMVYVDLNPIRANMVFYPEEYDSCSISERFNKVKFELKRLNINNVIISEELLYSFFQSDSLLHLGNIAFLDEKFHFSLYDYFNVVDMYAKVAIHNKAINKNTPYENIFSRLLK